MRKMALPEESHAILIDTVGFVRDLPHELIAAFRSTLQETKEADLILHLIDASDTDRWQRVRQVNAVLKELGADQVPRRLSTWSSRDLSWRILLPMSRRSVSSWVSPGPRSPMPPFYNER